MKTKLARPSAISAKSRRAIAKYGEDKCHRAYSLNRIYGEGPSTIGIYLELTTRGADAAINAGAELAKLGELAAKEVA